MRIRDAGRLLASKENLYRVEHGNYLPIGCTIPKPVQHRRLGVILEDTISWGF